MPSSNKTDEGSEISLHFELKYTQPAIMNGSIKLWCMALARKIRLERIGKLFRANKDYVDPYSAVLLWYGEFSQNSS